MRSKILHFDIDDEENFASEANHHEDNDINFLFTKFQSGHNTIQRKDGMPIKSNLVFRQYQEQ
jgi:hypothetical protein